MSGSVTVRREKLLKLQAALEQMDKFESRVGFFEDSKYGNGTPVAYIATIQEFGCAAKNIQSRSFMRTTQKERNAAWIAKFKSSVKAVAAGNETVASAWDILGSTAAGDVKKKIASIRTPPLGKATIRNRLRQAKAGKPIMRSASKPLIHTGVMWNAVTWQVIGK